MTGEASILDSIKEYIIEENLEVGDRLPTERALAGRLGKSRHSVREALKSLEALNVIKIRQGSGIYLNDPSFSFIDFPFELKLKQGMPVEDLIVARETVEVKIVSLACERAGAEDVNEMKKFISYRDTPAAKKRYDGVYDFEMERMVARAAGNEFLSLIQHMSHYLWMKYVKSHNMKNVEDINMSVREHKEILAAIIDKNEEAAVSAMLKHLRSVYTVINNEKNN